MQEYSLIMSERDTVHKEMEKLSDDLTQAFKKNKTLEVENKDFVEEVNLHSFQIFIYKVCQEKNQLTPHLCLYDSL
jgi:hypothetical protein